MKRLSYFLLVTALLFNLIGCSYQNPVIASLPAYQSKEFYTSGGSQDFTDYAKYVYAVDITPSLANSQYFQEATPADLAEIVLYLENFEQWVETIGRELKQNYDFDKSLLTPGDYFYLDSKYASESAYKKFYSYNIYFYDTDTGILYYFHNNI